MCVLWVAEIKYVCNCWHCSPSVRSRVSVTFGRQSVCLSVCLAGCSLLRVCCCGPGGLATSIDCCTAGAAVSSNGAAARCSAANANSHVDTDVESWAQTSQIPGARFTKYLTTILRLSYDNAKVAIDLRRTTNLPNRLTNVERLFLGMIHLQNCKIVRDSVRKLAYDIPKRSFSTF